MPNIELALKDGYTTGNGLGLGLAGAKRLSNEFAIESQAGRRDARHDRAVALNLDDHVSGRRGQPGRRNRAAPRWRLRGTSSASPKTRAGQAALVVVGAGDQSREARGTRWRAARPIRSRAGRRRSRTASRSSRSTRARDARRRASRGATGIRPPARSATDWDRSSGSPISSKSIRSRPAPWPWRVSGASRPAAPCAQPRHEIGAIRYRIPAKKSAATTGTGGMRDERFADHGRRRPRPRPLRPRGAAPGHRRRSSVSTRSARAGDRRCARGASRHARCRGRDDRRRSRTRGGPLRGLGNIGAVIIAADGTRQSLISQNGTAGTRRRRIQRVQLSRCRARDLLVMYSDGLAYPLGLAAIRVSSTAIPSSSPASSTAISAAGAMT